MKTILAKELNQHNNENPNSKYFVKCAWGLEEIILYFNGEMSLCGTPENLIIVEDN